MDYLMQNSPYYLTHSYGIGGLCLSNLEKRKKSPW